MNKLNQKWINRIAYRVARLGFTRWDRAVCFIASHYETQYVKRFGIPADLFEEYRQKIYERVCNKYGMSFTEPDDFFNMVPFACVRFDYSTF